MGPFQVQWFRSKDLEPQLFEDFAAHLLEERQCVRQQRLLVEELRSLEARRLHSNYLGLYQKESLVIVGVAGFVPAANADTVGSLETGQLQLIDWARIAKLESDLALEVACLDEFPSFEAAAGHVEAVVAVVVVVVAAVVVVESFVGQDD